MRALPLLAVAACGVTLPLDLKLSLSAQQQQHEPADAGPVCPPVSCGPPPAGDLHVQTTQDGGTMFFATCLGCLPVTLDDGFEISGAEVDAVLSVWATQRLCFQHAVLGHADAGFHFMRMDLPYEQAGSSEMDFDRGGRLLAARIIVNRDAGLSDVDLALLAGQALGYHSEAYSLVNPWNHPDTLMLTPSDRAVHLQMYADPPWCER